MKSKLPVFLAWAVSIILIFLGVFAVYWSSELDSKDPWLSNLLANIGPTLFLAAPLSLLAFLLDRAAKATNLQLRRLSLSLEQLQSESGELREKEFQAEKDLFESIQNALSFESLFESLKTAASRGYVTDHGIRVPFIWAQNHARFQPRKAGFLRRASVSMFIERDNGEQILELVWKRNANVRQFFSYMSKRMERGGHIQQDFDPVAPFKALSELLVFTSECKHNRRSSAIEGSPVLGGLDDWIFIDRGIVPKDTYYCVPWERFDSLDWLKHIEGKQWDSRESFPMAHHVACEWYPNLTGVRAPKLPLPTVAA